VRIPLAKYGIRELVLFGGLTLAAAVLAALAAIGFAMILFWPLALLFATGFVFVLCFFRDPTRRIPDTPGAVVAPADGKVVEVTEIAEAPLAGGRAVRIGIFMSLASVHVNRAPCAGRVEAVEHRPGRFLNAMDPASSAENESAAVVIGEAEGRPLKIVVRQVAGLLARRIVCDVAEGTRIERGQRIGMIKFGSRAEVYVPADSGFEVLVRPGQHATAGETILGRLR